jgi:hypothetical protein
MGYALPTNRRGDKIGVKYRLKDKKVRNPMRVNLPDTRLVERLERLVGQLSERPEASIPEACGSWHEAKAAYRFLG